MKVENRITIYEVDGQEPVSGQIAAELIVLSHWNRNRLVVLKLGKETVTVCANDLEMAIRNATNWKH